MSDLIVITFDTEEHAQGAYIKVQELQTELVVDLAGVALVKVDDSGKTHVTTPDSSTIEATGVASGGFFGIIIGLIFFAPVVGLVLGGLVGALFAGLDRTGIDANFRAQVKDAVKAGQSAVVVLARTMTVDKFTAALKPFGGTITKTSLSEDDERALVEDLT